MPESKTTVDTKSNGMSLVRKVRIVLLAVGAILVLVVVLQNTEAVETKVLFMTITAPRAVLLFGTTVIGFVLGLFTRTRFSK